jgi:hypothetical protein
MDAKKLVREVTAGAVAAGSLTVRHPVVVPKDVLDPGTTGVLYAAEIPTAFEAVASGGASASLRGTAQGNSGAHAWLTDQRAVNRLVGRNAGEQLREAVRASVANRKNDG